MNISLPNITAPSAGEARKTGSLVLPATARDGPAIATGMPDFGLAYDKSAEPFPGITPAQEPEPETGMTGTGQRPAKHAGGAGPEDLDASFMDRPHDNAEERSSPRLSEVASHPAVTGAAMPKPQAVRNPEITRDQMTVDDSTRDEVSAFHNRISPEANPQLQRILAPRQDHSVLRQQPEESHPDIAHEGPDARAQQLRWLAKRPGNMQWGQCRRNPQPRPWVKARSSPQPTGLVQRGTAGCKPMRADCRLSPGRRSSTVTRQQQNCRILRSAHAARPLWNVRWSAKWFGGTQKQADLQCCGPCPVMTRQ